MLSGRGLVVFGRIVDLIALATRWVSGRSLARSAYKLCCDLASHMLSWRY